MNTAESLSQDSRSPSRDLSPGPPEYESGMECKPDFHHWQHKTPSLHPFHFYTTHYYHRSPFNIIIQLILWKS
jgi:hypothetical protein